MIFDNVVQTNSGIVANLTIIAAPGANRSIILDSVNIAQSAGTAGAFVRFHPPGGANIATIVLVAASDSKQYVFPGPYKLAANTALQLDVVAAGAAVLEINTVYTIGAT